MERAKIKVTGDVQGVYYRFSAKMKAEELGLTGFAENESDDSVLVVVEGEAEKIKAFLRWLEVGPPMAEVENLEITKEKYSGEYKEFEVR